MLVIDPEGRDSNLDRQLKHQKSLRLLLGRIQTTENEVVLVTITQQNNKNYGEMHHKQNLECFITPAMINI